MQLERVAAIAWKDVYKTILLEERRHNTVKMLTLKLDHNVLEKSSSLQTTLTCSHPRYIFCATVKDKLEAFIKIVRRIVTKCDFWFVACAFL